MSNVNSQEEHADGTMESSQDTLEHVVGGGFSGPLPLFNDCGPALYNGSGTTTVSPGRGPFINANGGMSTSLMASYSQGQTHSHNSQDSQKSH